MSDEPKELIIPLEPSPEMRQAVEVVERMRLEFEHLTRLAEPKALFAQRNVSTGEQILMAIASTCQSSLHNHSERARSGFLRWREGDDYRPDSLIVK